jgi:regulation of enolase protein 1 (concanavalin A-like superfamily)
MHRTGLALLTLSLVLLLTNHLSFSQGRLVRGEVWKEYTLSDKKADFYVAKNGNDNWSGKLPDPNQAGTDGPFATPGKAQKAVRALKSKLYLPKKPALDKRFIGSPHPFGKGNDILVLIRDGVYSLDSTMVFNAADGGERIETELPTGAFEYHQLKDYYVTYASYPGEKATISGGEKITGWKKLDKTKWQVRLEVEEVKEIFANGQRQTLARTPNKGFFFTDGQPTEPDCFRFNPGDLKNWKDLETNRIHMVVRWGGIHSSLTRVDEKNRKAYLKNPDEELLNVPPRYYVDNMYSLLDSAGEWFFDQKTKLLTYIPDKGIDNPNQATILLPKTAGLIKASGSREKPLRNLRFYNLAFSSTLPGGKSTIDFTYAKNCEVLKNTIENVSQTAIFFGEGSYHNIIGDNVIQNITGSGIAVFGSPLPNQWADLVSDNIVTRNEITNLRPAMVGIRTANALRTTIARNYVSNTGSYGITVGSWPNVEETSDGSHLVEFNHVSFTNMARDDEGAIAVYGLSPGSVVRENLIHDVKPAATNENVGLFFQNMASGWTLSNNILFGLKQAEMKLCAAYLENNIYTGNHLIERPETEPEKIIEGLPDFRFSELKVLAEEGLITGRRIRFTAEVLNAGSTGNMQVPLYIDGITAIQQLFPVISGNRRKAEFTYQFFNPGKHTVAIGNTTEQTIEISGEAIHVLYSNLRTEVAEMPLGDSLKVSAEIKNTLQEPLSQAVSFVADGKIIVTRNILFRANELKTVTFSLLPEAGNHEVTIGNHPPLTVRVYPLKKIIFGQKDLQTFCSSTAKPCQYEYSTEKNSFSITARGTDFLHAEDSYGTIYLPKAVKGNFVATVRIVELGKDVSDWFRFGIFARNDLVKDEKTGKGSAGSFLMFSTPKRNGAQWDEFGDGSMHNSKSMNYNLENPFPVWLKVVRHQDRFSGYYSLDGKSWVLCRESGDIAGLAKTLDIGLAAGSNDQKSSMIRFEDFQIWIEQEK